MGTLNATVNLTLGGSFDNALDIGGASYPIQYGANFVLSHGTGANQTQSIFTDTRTLAASGTENLDLAGSLTDAFGATITFTKIKALIVKAAAGNTNDVVVSPAASNGFVAPFNAATDKLKVKPGGLLLLAAPDANGYAVTAGTGDLLTIANSAGGSAVSYDIILIGV